MALYFFGGSHDRFQKIPKLEELGFKDETRSPRHITEKVLYVLRDEKSLEAITVGFNIDVADGRVQLQGSYTHDVQSFGKNSKQYALFEKLADILKPNEVLDDNADPVFPELVRK